MPRHMPRHAKAYAKAYLCICPGIYLGMSVAMVVMDGGKDDEVSGRRLPRLTESAKNERMDSFNQDVKSKLP